MSAGGLLEGSIEDPFPRHLRWFALPSEATAFAKGRPVVAAVAVLRPLKYPVAAAEEPVAATAPHQRQAEPPDEAQNVPEAGVCAGVPARQEAGVSVPVRT